MLVDGRRARIEGGGGGDSRTSPTGAIKKKKERVGLVRRTVECALHIDSEHVIPSVLWEVAERPTPCDSRVVYKDVQFRLPFLEFADESIAAGFGLVAQTREEIIYGRRSRWWGVVV